MSQPKPPSHQDLTPSLRTAERLLASTLVALLGLLSACGGRPEQASIETPSGGIAAAQAATESISHAAGVTLAAAQTRVSAGSATTARHGVLLPGLPGENAFSALQPYVAGDRQSEAAQQPAAAVNQPTPLNATLDMAATVGQVNAALDAVGARIVAMQPGRKTLAIELAPLGGGSPSTNQQAAASLLASHAFQSVQGPGLPALPNELTIDPDAAERLRHDGPSS